MLPLQPNGQASLVETGVYMIALNGGGAQNEKRGPRPSFAIKTCCRSPAAITAAASAVGVAPPAHAIGIAAAAHAVTIAIDPRRGADAAVRAAHQRNTLDVGGR